MDIGVKVKNEIKYKYYIPYIIKIMTNILMKIIKHDNKVLSDVDIKILDNLLKPDHIQPQINDYGIESLRYLLDNKSHINYDTDFIFEQHDNNSYELILIHKKTRYEAIFDKKEITNFSFLFDGNRIESFKDFLDEFEEHVENTEFDDDWVDIEIKVDYGFGSDEFTITLFNESKKDEKNSLVPIQSSIEQISLFHRLFDNDGDNDEWDDEESIEPLSIIISP